ncbi:hypothetical protein CANCADRAFT_29954 [Tortispora caseinolytica NRRL Y-17796]|uniref:Uncharacterized protein n=1 Tax=Tortispora caseinolytica NRRL Y-17796 TaxID=767744 RepID=A0A1E4TII4_9ASCO|nr:hypothetical protein CANCADRAFT_29954 [Tortispora caseinolytica NRRL Y-17796]
MVYYYYDNSAWYSWGKWVVVGICCFLAVLFFSCAFWRRKRGQSVIPYTNIGRPPPYTPPAQPQYGQYPGYQNNGYQNTAPQGYQQPAAGTNAGYYGNQSSPSNGQMGGYNAGINNNPEGTSPYPPAYKS